NCGLTPFDAAMQDKPQTLLPKPQLPIVPLPGSRPLSNVRHQHYCRLRSLLCPKGQALREAGMRAVKNHDAVSNATRLERRQDVRDRIAFLVRQEEEVLTEKRKRTRKRCGPSTRPTSATISKPMKRSNAIIQASQHVRTGARFRPKRACGEAS